MYPSFPVLRTDDDGAERNGLCEELNKMKMSTFTACIEAALDECLETHGDNPEALKSAFRALVREYSLLLLCKGHFIRAGTSLVKYGALFKKASISGPCLCSLSALALPACIHMWLRRAVCLRPCCVCVRRASSCGAAQLAAASPTSSAPSCASSPATRRWRGCTIGHA